MNVSRHTSGPRNYDWQYFGIHEQRDPGRCHDGTATVIVLPLFVVVMSGGLMRAAFDWQGLGQRLSAGYTSSLAFRAGDPVVDRDALVTIMHAASSR